MVRRTRLACKAQEVFLILAGAAVEFCPGIFQQPLVPELLLGVVMAVAWWFWPPSATNSAVYRAMGLLIAYMWLVPSRDFGSNPAMGRIKWLLVLVAIELVFGTRVPGTELAALVVIAIGLLALAIDSWLAGFIPSSQGNSARTNAGALFLRWTVLPVLLVIAAANLMGIWIVETTASYHVAHQPGRANEFGEELELLSMPENASFGDHRSVERDPRIAARLFWETGSAPTGIVYLRALALPDLVLSESTITYRGSRRRTPNVSRDVHSQSLGAARPGCQQQRGRPAPGWKRRGRAAGNFRGRCRKSLQHRASQSSLYLPRWLRRSAAQGRSF